MMPKFTREEVAAEAERLMKALPSETTTDAELIGRMALMSLSIASLASSLKRAQADAQAQCLEKFETANAQQREVNALREKLFAASMFIRDLGRPEEADVLLKISKAGP